MVIIDGVAERLARRDGRTAGSPDPADPRPAAIVGAAFACLIAARATYLASDQSRPFSEVLDESMSAFRIH